MVGDSAYPTAQAEATMTFLLFVYPGLKTKYEVIDE